MCCSQSVQAMLVHLEMGPGPYVSDEWPLTFSVAIVMFSLDGLHWGISFKGVGVWVGDYGWVFMLGVAPWGQGMLVVTRVLGGAGGVCHHYPFACPQGIP